MVSSRERGSQDFEKAIEFLNDGRTTSYNVVYDRVGPRCVDAMVHAHKLSKDPVKNADYESCILDVRIDPISKVSRVAVVSDVVHNLQCSRNMKSNRFGMRSDREIPQFADQRIRIERAPKRGGRTRGLVLEHAKCRFRKAPAFNCRKSKSAQVVVGL